MSLAHGGHLTHGHPVSVTGKLWKPVQYGVWPEDGPIDYDQVAARIKKVPGVVEAEPFIYTQVMFSAPGNISGGVIRAVDLETIKSGGPKALKIQKGNFADLAQGGPEDPPRVAIGNEMARTLNLNPGDYFNIISPLGTLTPMGRMPRMNPVLVAAVFHTGMYEFDSNLAFISIPRMQIKCRGNHPSVSAKHEVMLYLRVG